ncbi:MAG: PD-(D/E)XK nuclease family protein [Ekhidna sp.]|nr:PD-(D/E)XK nuclease family protein [Ekhidna sp.]
MSFLSEVADHLLAKYPYRLGDCTVVFPNRRAGLFLKKALSKKVDRPVWSPTVLSLEDFLFSSSDIKKADPLALIFELYEAFKSQQVRAEGFESFYFWGEMLLKDFEEIDHYLVDPKQLFTYVKDDRQLAEDFSFLNPDQEAIIKKFWQGFLPASTKTQEQFVATWKILLPVYEEFKRRIREKKIGYAAHIYRELLTKSAESKESVKHPDNKPLLFAGFNVLTLAEEKLIKHFISENKAEILWDIDTYYVDSTEQEAGEFLRRYKSDNVFGTSFPTSPPRRIKEKKDIEITGVALEVGQAKLAGQEIADLIQSGVKSEEIVIVLPQDYMLFPVLNAIPDTVHKLNVTMGYPLKDTPLFGLLESAIELQEQARFSPDNGLSFYHKPTIDILSHPYLYKEDKNPLNGFIKAIKRSNKIRIFQQEISALQLPVLHTIFRQVNDQSDLTNYLQDIVKVLGDQVIERLGLEREYLYHFQQLLARLEEMLTGEQHTAIDTKTFKRLFRKVTRSVRMPFSGEPVEGLQIMGVLETRNLDFKHVFMLNMNEDIFPASQRTGSFIPYRIRKAFDLPTFETQDTIYAYLFYRLLQRSKKLSFYYNLSADFGLSGEVSRFIRQLELESGLAIKHKKLNNSIQVHEIKPIAIEKTADVLKRLEIYTNAALEETPRRLSASALNSYFDCKLKFYFRYVLRLFSAEEMSDDLDARRFGNVLHKTLEYLYQDTINEKGSRIIDENDFLRLESSIDGAMNKAFKESFGMRGKKHFEFKGRNVVMAEIIRKFVRQVLKMDKAHAPFEIISLEKDDNYTHFIDIEPDGKPLKVKLGADIDRVDRKGEEVRVIDYKTGRDNTEIGSFDSLFEREVSQTYQAGRKAGFQTLFYAWLYGAKYGQSHATVPGLININQFFREGFDYRIKQKGTPMEDARP